MLEGIHCLNWYKRTNMLKTEKVLTKDEQRCHFFKRNIIIEMRLVSF